MKSVLIIGCGAMGGAILSGCLARGVWQKEEVLLKEHDEAASREKAARYGVSWSADGHEAAEADTILLAVKPGVVPEAARKIAAFHPKGTVISIAAAVTLSDLASYFPEGTRIVRVMPNTPASVGEGYAAIATGEAAGAEDVEKAKNIFGALGRAAVVTERQLDELGALSGAGPGYTFVIIDALADAGVNIGLPRQVAIEAAAQTLYGAAKMVLETGRHPAQLRDQVTSPGGTTIAGIQMMERRGLRSALIDGVEACLAKSDAMAKK